MAKALKCDRCGKLIEARIGYPAFSLGRITRVTDCGVDQYGNYYRTYHDETGIDLCPACSKEFEEIFMLNKIPEKAFFDPRFDEEEEEDDG